VKERQKRESCGEVRVRDTTLVRRMTDIGSESSQAVPVRREIIAVYSEDHTYCAARHEKFICNTAPTKRQAKAFDCENNEIL
jgi:hypothetical protein